MESKQCTKCKRVLPLSTYRRKYDGRKNDHCSECKDCYNNRGTNVVLDVTQKRKCNKCHRILYITEFPKTKQQCKGFKNSCRSCEAIRHAKNRGCFIDTDISPDYYEKMLEKQDGKCDICGTTDPSKNDSRRTRFSIDHNHRTGKMRGLLCNDCNRFIGLMNDDPNLVLQAYLYLVSHDYS